MELLKDYTDEQVLRLAGEPTPKPMAGTWTLTAPDGRTWTADAPLRVVSAEMHDRVPTLVALARIRRSLIEEGAACAVAPPVSNAHVAPGCEQFTEAEDVQDAEIARLRAFRDFFTDRCEMLFFHFGMEPVELFNRGQDLTPNVFVQRLPKAVRWNKWLGVAR